jgi:hypothetical protein
MLIILYHCIAVYYKDGIHFGYSIETSKKGNEQDNPFTYNYFNNSLWQSVCPGDKALDPSGLHKLCRGEQYRSTEADASDRIG